MITTFAVQAAVVLVALLGFACVCGVYDDRVPVKRRYLSIEPILILIGAYVVTVLALAASLKVLEVFVAGR